MCGHDYNLALYVRVCRHGTVPLTPRSSLDPYSPSTPPLYPTTPRSLNLALHAGVVEGRVCRYDVPVSLTLRPILMVSLNPYSPFTPPLYPTTPRTLNLALHAGVVKGSVCRYDVRVSQQRYRQLCGHRCKSGLTGTGSPGGRVVGDDE